VRSMLGSAMRRLASLLLGRPRAVLGVSAFCAFWLREPEVMAWGKLGHRVASTLAENHLAPLARSAVRDLLEPGESLADASLWADLHRHDTPGGGAWHYVNVPIGEARYAPSSAPTPAAWSPRSPSYAASSREHGPPRRQAASAAPPRALGRRSPSAAARGESRQPRGQRLQVSSSSGAEPPLPLGRRHDRARAQDETTWVRDLEALATPEQTRRWARGGTEAWASESLAAARQAYASPEAPASWLAPGAQLGDSYYRLELPVVRQRLAQAAYAWRGCSTRLSNSAYVLGSRRFDGSGLEIISQSPKGLVLYAPPTFAWGSWSSGSASAPRSSSSYSPGGSPRLRRYLPLLSIPFSLAWLLAGAFFLTGSSDGDVHHQLALGANRATAVRFSHPPRSDPWRDHRGRVEQRSGGKAIALVGAMG